MKKAIAILLAVMLVVSMAPAAFASTTTLTTTVPDASYKFSIPADTKIDYNATDTSIGYLCVTESSGFAVGKDLRIEITFAPFACEGVESTIPYTLKFASTTKMDDTTRAASHNGQFTNYKVRFEGKNDGTVNRLASTTSATAYIGDIGVIISSADWGKALAGNYTSTITFTAEVVQD